LPPQTSTTAPRRAHGARNVCPAAACMRSDPRRSPQSRV
jgi:hypothetical protein